MLFLWIGSQNDWCFCLEVSVGQRPPVVTWLE